MSNFVPALSPAAAQRPASNTAAIATLAATPNTPWLLGGLRWSYDAAPTGGKITVAWNNGVANVQEDYLVTAAGPGFMPFDPPLEFPIGKAVTVTLAAGGSGVTGAIYLTAWS